MKQRYVMVALLAVAAVQTGCEKKDAAEQAEEGKMQLVVEPKQDDSKAAVSGSTVIWNPGGETLLVNGSFHRVTVSGNGNVAEVEVTPSDGGYKCCYPAGYTSSQYHSYINNDFIGSSLYTPIGINYTNNSDGTYSFNYPKRYDSYLLSDGKQVLDMPMLGVAQRGDSKIKLNHITGSLLVMVQNNLKVPFVIDSVVVKSSNCMLSGRIKVKQDGTAVYNTASPSSAAEREVCVSYSFGRVIGALNGGMQEGMDVPLPPGTHSALTVRVCGHLQTDFPMTVSNPKVVYERTVNNVTITRNKQMRARVEIDFTNEYSNKGNLPVFTVNSNGRCVVFSRGNLMHHFKSGNTFITEFRRLAIQYCDSMALGSPEGSRAETSWADGTSFRKMVPHSVLATLQRQHKLLLIGELRYLFNTREVSFHRYMAATLNISGKQYKGVVLFPDNFTMPSGVTITGATYNSMSNYTASVSAGDWQKLEAAGCVFLQAQGYHKAQQHASEAPGNNNEYNEAGYYWMGSGAYYMKFNSSGLTINTSQTFSPGTGVDANRWFTARDVLIVQG